MIFLNFNSSPITKTGTVGYCLVRVMRNHFSFQSSTFKQLATAILIQS